MCQPSHDHGHLAHQLCATCTRSLLIPILSIGDEPKARRAFQDKSPTAVLTQQPRGFTPFLSINRIQSLSPSQEGDICFSCGKLYILRIWEHLWGHYLVALCASTRCHDAIQLQNVHTLQDQSPGSIKLQLPCPTLANGPGWYFPSP